jgi:hypothetical protein
MAFLSSLIPGLREVRAPLLGGYLWLLFAFLVFHPQVSASGESHVHAELAEVAGAIGPVGLAITAAIAAYLFGSLVLSVFIGATSFLRKEGWLFWPVSRRSYKPPEPEMELDREGWVSLDAIAHLAGLTRYVRARVQRDVVLDEQLRIAIGDLARVELAEERGKLQAALKSQKALQGDATFRLERRPGWELVAIFRDTNTGIDAEHPIPKFDPLEDLYRDVPLLATRLSEFAPVAGAKVDRLGAEAELRFAVSLPLVALIILFAGAVDWRWIFALPLASAVFYQGIRVERRRDEELIGALRARGGGDELEKITPVFRQYREHCAELRQALKDADWSVSQPPTIPCKRAIW